MVRTLPLPLVATLFASGCISGGGGGCGGSPVTATLSRGQLLSKVKSFGYQLQGLDAAGQSAIRDSTFGLVVIDYSQDGSAAGELTAAQCERMKNQGAAVRSKLIISYLSIGEAEVARFYFDPAWVTRNPDGTYTINRPPAPDFLHSSNPSWPDNFKVRYWDPVWQRIIIKNPGGHPIIGDQKSYLDRIIDAGFDGVYLDIIDGFEFFGPRENGGNDERRSAAQDMIAFVAAIARHARDVRGRPNFLVIPQNGSTILNPSAFPEDSLPPGMTLESFALQQGLVYLAAMDAIGAEDTFYFGTRAENNPSNVQSVVLEALRKFRSADKAVLAIDYLSPLKDNPDDLPFPVTIDDFYQRCRVEGFTPYATVRALDTLTVNPSQPPAR